MKYLNTLMHKTLKSLDLLMRKYNFCIFEPKSSH